MSLRSLWHHKEWSGASLKCGIFYYGVVTRLCGVMRMNFGECRKADVQLLRIHLPRTPVNKDKLSSVHRQTFTLITSKWWSKVQTGASRRVLIAASTVSNRVRSWFRYGRIVSEAS